MKNKIYLLLIMTFLFVDGICQNKKQDFKYEILDDWLKLNIEANTITTTLGKPDKKGDDEYWSAIGLNVQKWEYIEKGIILEMSSENKNSEKSVLMITTTKPNQFKTSKGIKIGSNKEQVLECYKQEIDSTSSSENQIIVGSIYGGIIFDFANNKVSKIFIGEAAE